MSQTDIAFEKLDEQFKRGKHSKYCENDWVVFDKYCENDWVVFDWSTIDTYLTLTICHNEKHSDTVDNCSALCLMLEIENSDDSCTVKLATELCDRVDNLIEFAKHDCVTIDDIRDNLKYRKTMLQDDAISYHAMATENRNCGQWSLYYAHCRAYDMACECERMVDRAVDMLATFETLTIREW